MRKWGPFLLEIVVDGAYWPIMGPKPPRCGRSLILNGNKKSKS